MVPKHQNYVHCCSFVVAAVKSEETESWGTESITEESRIRTLQLASFGADEDERHVLEKKNHHGTSCGFLELQCAASSVFVP
jgi:hypothetical protein